MSIKKTILFALTAILSTVLYGQDILFKGRVLDAEYLTPVPYAAVYIHNTLNGTIADNVGEFSFEVPDSLRSETLVIAREKYDIQYLEIEGQFASELVVFWNRTILLCTLRSFRIVWLPVQANLLLH